MNNTGCLIINKRSILFCFFFSSRRRHTRSLRDWSSDVCSSDLKIRFMFGGKASVPLVVRLPGGSGTGAAAQHSQSLEAWFAHVPGLKVVQPSTPHDAKGLLLAAIDDPNPVLVFEHKLLYKTKGPVPEEPYRVPIGEAVVRREGRDLTIVAASVM